MSKVRKQATDDTERPAIGSLSPDVATESFAVEDNWAGFFSEEAANSATSALLIGPSTDNYCGEVLGSVSPEHLNWVADYSGVPILRFQWKIPPPEVLSSPQENSMASFTRRSLGHSKNQLPSQTPTPVQQPEAEGAVEAGASKMGTFSEELLEFVKPLLSMQRELVAIGIEAYVKIPKIAVVGEQSTGKTSLLEMVIGMSCLPKSEELATRRPLSLKLTHDESLTTPRYFIGESMSAMRQVSNAESLCAEIQRLTDTVAGRRGMIVRRELYAEIKSADCPELTLIDLPGIAKNPLVDSDQPDDIEEITKELIAEYLQQKEAIILAVIPAVVDPQASDALKFARKFDPEMLRTVGVLTKVDMMAANTDCRRTLEGRTVQLRHGMVAVKNRSKKDIDDGKSIQTALLEEIKYFRTHPVYKEMDPKFFGAKMLSAKLMQLLGQQIQQQLPEIRQKVKMGIHSAQKELQALGMSIPSDKAAQKEAVVRLLKGFADTLGQTVTGNLASGSLKVGGGRGGLAVIRSHFQEFSAKVAQEHRLTWDTFSDEYISDQMLSCRDTMLPQFPSFQAFNLLVEEHLQVLQEAAMDVLSSVEDHLLDLVMAVGKQRLTHHPMLLESATVRASNMVRKFADEARRSIAAMIASYKNIYTADSDYVDISTFSLPAAVPNMSIETKEEGEEVDSTQAAATSAEVTAVAKQPTSMSDYLNEASKISVIERDDTAIIHSLKQKLVAYGKVVGRSAMDAVPRFVDSFLLEKLHNELFLELQKAITMPVSDDDAAEDGELVGEVDEAEMYAILLQEQPQLQQKRTSLSRQLATLRKAEKIISSYRENK